MFKRKRREAALKHRKAANLEMAQIDQGEDLKAQQSLIKGIKVADEVSFLGAKASVTFVAEPHFYYHHHYCYGAAEYVDVRLSDAHVKVLYMDPVKGLSQREFSGEAIKILKRLS